jgi:hypothetical protein
MERVLIKGKAHWLQVDEVLVSGGGQGSVNKEGINY